MGKIVLLLLALSLVAIAEGRNLNLKKLRRKRAPLPMESERREVCIEDLGCYPNTNPGVEESWSFSQAYIDQILRDRRSYIGTEFRWWAPGASEARVIKNKNLDFSGFDAGLKVKFIVHGYLGGYAEWPLTMKDAFMRQEQCNVFIVNWAEGSAPRYVNAVANTWVVGAEIGHFIVQLVKKTGLKIEDIHVIGHNLGAHISGFAGKWVKHRLEKKPIGRITGLDPVGPLFDDKIPGERLHRGDAALVDVIHTNWANSSSARPDLYDQVMRRRHYMRDPRMYLVQFNWVYFGSGGLGLFDAVGHFDFYPNGGEDQPGCMTQTKALFSWRFDFQEFSCSHSRAIDLFTESIESKPCKFLADQCTTWEAYKEGKCPPGKEDTLNVQMGYHADEYRQYIDGSGHKSFFLDTNGGPPYCKGE